MKIRLTMGCAALAVVGMVSLAAQAGSLSEEHFQQVRALVRPAEGDQPWAEQIAWRTSLWEARREAAAEGKPILLWEMDGHPLGCT